MSIVEIQRVVVLQDASRELSSSAIRWVVQGLSLKPGDELTLVGILHQVNNPMGYKSKVDNSIFGANSRVVQEEVVKKKEEYHNKEEIIEISRQCEKAKIIFHIEVQVGPSARIVALKAAKSLKATWVVLDRHMKKDIKFLMERLPCGISRMKRNNTVEELRWPKPIEDLVLFSYDEMIPVNVKQQIIPKKSSNPHKTKLDKHQQAIESSGEFQFSSSCKSNSSFITSSSSQPSSTYSPPTLRITKTSPSHFQEPKPQQNNDDNDNNDYIRGTHQVFKNSECSICMNKRPKIGWKRDFTYAELHAATNGFSDKNFLSEGGFGSVFRGKIDGLKVAVKQHKNASFQGEKEFKAEVQVLSKARHENVVMLLGSCSEGSHRLLVYEYVCNGSLDQHLSKYARQPLSWEKRLKIGLDTAKGLKYMHDNNIVHRDMRPNNILVTHDHESMLGDFGLARTQHEGSDHSSDTRVVGTLGYLAPEYAECGKVSTKTDVYSFGVVLLQLITGKTTTDKVLNGKSLVGWARPLLKQRNYPSLIDKRILDSHDVHQLFWMVRVAEKCLSKDPQKRVTMDKVVCALDNIRQGNTICHMSEFSPAHSDSLSSSLDGSIGTDTASTNKSCPITEHVVVSLPPTSIVTLESSSSSSSTCVGESNMGRRNSSKKKRDKPRSRPKICYDTMVE